MVTTRFDQPHRCRSRPAWLGQERTNVIDLAEML
jgi:hypothetical protein